MRRATVSATLLLAVLSILPGCTTATGPFDRGVARYREGRYPAALAAFDEAVRQSPSGAAYSNRAVARVRLGDIPGAIEDYSRALELAPQDPEILFNRGNAYVAAGNTTAAIADFSRAWELRPSFAKALFNRGTARALAGDVEGARSDWRQAGDIETDPWARAAMRRSAGLEPLTLWSEPAARTPAAVAAPETPAAQPSASPAVSGESLDARALAMRAIGRQIDGDRPGALRDLNTALGLTDDPVRRANIHYLIRLLEGQR